MVIEGPLPAPILRSVRQLHIAAYAIIQELDGTLDESLHLIGRLAEIDRRIAALTPLSADEPRTRLRWRGLQ